LIESEKKCKKSAQNSDKELFVSAQENLTQARELAGETSLGKVGQAVIDIKNIQNCLIVTRRWDAAVSLAKTVENALKSYQDDLQKGIYLDSLNYGGWALYQHGELRKALETRFEILKIEGKAFNWDIGRRLAMAEQAISMAIEARDYVATDKIQEKVNLLIDEIPIADAKEKAISKTALLMISARVSASKGDFDKTLKLLGEAELTRAASIDTNNDARFFAYLYEFRGVAFSGLRQFNEAIVAYKRSIEFANISDESTRDQLANTFYNIAVAYNELGQYGEAQTALKSAISSKNSRITNLEILEKNISQLATGINFNKNKVSLQDLSIFESKVINATNELPNNTGDTPYLGSLYLTKAGMLLDLGKENEAMQAVREAVTKISESIQVILPKLADKEKESTKRIIEGDLEAIFSHIGKVSNLKKANDLFFFTVLNTHGLIQEVALKQSQLKKGSFAIREDSIKLESIISKQSDPTLNPSTRAQLASAKEVLEHRINASLPELKPIIVTSGQIDNHLRKQSAIIEFVKYREWDRNKPRSNRWGDQRYLALVYRSGIGTESIDLGKAIQIDLLINKALTSISNNYNKEDNHQILENLQFMIFSKLKPFLSGSTELFIVPDGEINRLPISALPMFQKPNIKYRILTTARDLMRVGTVSKSKKYSVVLADPNFDKGINVSIGDDKAVSKRTNSRSSIYQLWPMLPGTKREGRIVSSILKASLFTGDNATVTSLKYTKIPLIIHIASHGFLLEEADRVNADPLLNVGIVLAGANANNQGAGRNDGLLTAAAVSTLNLRGTELVVLSACDTANGSIHTGEGIYGLQRALSIAGAGSTVLSLWKVDDQVTVEFMRHFYQRLLAGEGRSDALASTQLDFRNGRIGKGKWKDPYYWAAWQLVGDWRPIPGL
jgi:CHAT domain-containing protein